MSDNYPRTNVAPAENPRISILPSGGTKNLSQKSEKYNSFSDTASAKAMICFPD